MSKLTIKELKLQVQELEEALAASEVYRQMWLSKFNEADALRAAAQDQSLHWLGEFNAKAHDLSLARLTICDMAEQVSNLVKQVEALDDENSDLEHQLELNDKSAELLIHQVTVLTNALGEKQGLPSFAVQ